MTPAIDRLVTLDIDHAVHRYEHADSATHYGMEAAEQLGVDARRVFKTLVARLDTGELVVAAVPVSERLRLKSLAATAQAKKAAMADAPAVERATGYVLGGVSPLGQKKKLRTFIDASARAFDTIYVSGGRRGLEIELAPDALGSLTGARFAELAEQ